MRNQRFGFLLSGRWIGLILLLVIAAGVCVRLGFWQFDRHESKVERAELIEGHYSAEPIALADLAQPVGQPDQWRNIRMEGRFVGGGVLAPHRPVDGSPADHVLGLFEEDRTGLIVAVNVGWYPTDAFHDRSGYLELPAGPVTITGHLRLAEPDIDVELAHGQVRSINPELIWHNSTLAPTSGAQNLSEAPPQLVTDFYLELDRSETPALVPGLTGHRPPDTSLGSHLSYSMQWWVFGAGCLLSIVLLARREADDRDAEAVGIPGPEALDGFDGTRPGSSTTTAREGGGSTQSRRRRWSPRIGQADADLEDALIDAQLGNAALDEKNQDESALRIG